MNQLDHLVKGQERIERNLEALGKELRDHVKLSGEQHTDMSVKLGQGVMKFTEHERDIEELKEFAKTAKERMYKTIGGATVVFFIVGVIIQLLIK